MSDNVVKLPEPPKPPEWMIGPFQEWPVVIEGRRIPHLEAYGTSEGFVHFSLDKRFGLDVPAALAYQVAWFVSNAIAVGAGYPSLGAESKDVPFAPHCVGLSEVPK